MATCRSFLQPLSQRVYGSLPLANDLAFMNRIQWKWHSWLPVPKQEMQSGFSLILPFCLFLLCLLFFLFSLLSGYMHLGSPEPTCKTFAAPNHHAAETLGERPHRERWKCPRSPVGLLSWTMRHVNEQASRWVHTPAFELLQWSRDKLILPSLAQIKIHDQNKWSCFKSLSSGVLGCTAVDKWNTHGNLQVEVSSVSFCFYIWQIFFTTSGLSCYLPHFMLIKIFSYFCAFLFILVELWVKRK